MKKIFFLSAFVPLFLFCAVSSSFAQEDYDFENYSEEESIQQEQENVKKQKTSYKKNNKQNKAKKFGKKTGYKNKKQKSKTYADKKAQSTEEENESISGQKKAETQEAAKEIDYSEYVLDFQIPAGWNEDKRAGRGADFAIKNGSAYFKVLTEDSVCSTEGAYSDAEELKAQYKTRDNPSKTKSVIAGKGITGSYFSIDDGRSEHYYGFICAGASEYSITLLNASYSYFKQALTSLKMVSPDEAEKSGKANNGEKTINAVKPSLKPVVYSTDKPSRE